MIGTQWITLVCASLAVCAPQSWDMLLLFLALIQLPMQQHTHMGQPRQVLRRACACGADTIVETASLAGIAPPEPNYAHSIAVRAQLVS